MVYHLDPLMISNPMYDIKSDSHWTTGQMALLTLLLAVTLTMPLLAACMCRHKQCKRLAAAAAAPPPPMYDDYDLDELLNGFRGGCATHDTRNLVRCL